MGIATARASNVIGPGDYNMSRLIPYLLKTFSEDKIPKIRNLDAIRPWQYVLDVLWGYLLLGEKLYMSPEMHKSYNGAYNFGPDDDGFLTVKEVVEMVGHCFGNTEYKLDLYRKGSNKETKILKLDSTKAKTELNWKHEKNLKETIEITVEFVKQEKKGIPVDILSRSQVKAYLEGIK